MKNIDIRNLSVQDLTEKLASLKKNYSDLKFSHKVSALENPMQIRFLRKTIARVTTELSYRELHNS